MLSKEDVIRRIGEDNWDEFDLFMMEREMSLDEDGFEVYYIGDVVDFEATIQHA